MFDADFLPTPDFLKKAVPHFADNKVAFVQGCWDHLNRDFNLLTQVQAILLDGHFVFEHTARHRSNAFFNFSGTAGMWRVAAIADAGGMAARHHHRGLPTSATGPSSRAGAASTSRTWWSPPNSPWRSTHSRASSIAGPRVMPRSSAKLMKTLLTSKESLHTKAECWFHLTANCNYLLMVILAIIMVPCMILRAGTSPKMLIMTDAPFFILNAVSVGLYFGLSQREASNNKNWIRRMKYIPGLMSLGIGLGLNQAKAVLEGFFTDDIEFKRTPKLGVDQHGNAASKRAYKVPKSLVTFLELGFAFYYFAALIVSIYLRKWASVPFLWLFFSGFAYIRPHVHGRYAAIPPSCDGRAGRPRERLQLRAVAPQMARPRRLSAVALRYQPEAPFLDSAPRLVAKGQGLLADRILELAKEHHIPVEQDADLLALLEPLDVNRMIPKELFQAVSPSCWRRSTRPISPRGRSAPACSV